MGIDEAGRGPVLAPMVYGCLYCARSYQKTVSTLNFADSKTLKEEKREDLFENLKADESIGWAVDVIDPPVLSSKMLRKNKINLNEMSHDSAIGLISTVLNTGVLLTEVYYWPVFHETLLKWNVENCRNNIWDLARMLEHGLLYTVAVREPRDKKLDVTGIVLPYILKKLVFQKNLEVTR